MTEESAHASYIMLQHGEGMYDTSWLSIAVISLIVGGVGIIKTLYTSVIERTREIGTLKAIGTESKNILFLFLIEALLTGIIGATLGLVGVWAADMYWETWDPVMDRH